MNAQYKVIAFDADDTLFINEPYFDEAEERFCALLSDYLSKQSLSQALFKTQIDNLPLYGYGIKGYVLSMIQTAYEVTNHTVSTKVMEKIIAIGKELLQKPIVLLDGVEETLQQLQGKYKLVVATKGDLKDQHRKLHLSGLGNFFHHIEVMVEKEMIDYEKLLNRLEISPKEFLMIGNSLKSDVLPVINLGATAVHIPFHTTWAHERIDHEIIHPNFYTVKNINEVIELLKL
ncbi:MAG TPA: HAD family hydrolase [Flavobacterium sp.]|nr:HAD family hydrolase [Flavobacterium sp.]